MAEMAMSAESLTEMGLYDEPSWASLCEEVSKINITRPGAEVVELRATGTAPAQASGTQSKKGGRKLAWIKRKVGDPNGTLRR